MDIVPDLSVSARFSENVEQTRAFFMQDMRIIFRLLAEGRGVITKATRQRFGRRFVEKEGLCKGCYEMFSRRENRENSGLNVECVI
jgi:hypothetical protein